MIFRLRDFVFYPGVIKRFRGFLSESERWPQERLRAWVQERLERTLVHASTRVPYYKRTLAPFGGRFAPMVQRLDLTELPYLTKEDVRSHFEELRADNWKEYR